MGKKYYFDTCIWMDFYYGRKNRNGKDIGKFASDLISKIIKEKSTILFSKLNIKELIRIMESQEVELMLGFLQKIGVLKRIAINDSQIDEARHASKMLFLPFPDVLHSILARDAEAILITRDNHFRFLRDFCHVQKPEDIICASP